MGFVTPLPYWLFIVLSLVSRVCSGLAFACVYTASISLLAHSFPDSIDKYFSISEFCAGAGLIGGPALVSFLYKIITFSELVIGIGSVMAIFVPIVWFTVPTEKAESGSLRKSMWELMLYKDVTLDLLVQLYVNIVYAYLDPFLGLYIYHKGYNELFIGIAFSFLTGFYMLTCIFLFFYAKFMINFNWMQMGVVLAAIGIFLVGGVEYFFEENIVLIFFAMVLIGIGTSLGFVVSVPSMVQATQHLEIEGVYDMISGLFGVFFTLGQIIGPQIGSNVVSALGSKLSSCLMSAIGFGLITLYSIFRSREPASLKEPLLKY